ncbi:MAG: endonuclease VII domain-containing protein [Steroidobacteraceae bacterium]
MKQCPNCRRLGAGPKPCSEFNKSSAAQDGLQSWCRDCNNQRYQANSETVRLRSKEWYLANHARAKARQKEYGQLKRDSQSPAERAERHLKYTYGITTEQYAAMFAAQNGRCAICCTPMLSQLVEDKAQSKLRVAHVDHCHTTKSVRGLLCFDCNTGLGKLRDNEQFLLSAVRYLRASRATEQSESRTQHETLQGKTEPTSRDLESSTGCGRQQKENSIRTLN